MPPAVDSRAASARNTARMCRRLAPIARIRPISEVRSDTETSITFMMPMPATESEIAAIATSASVSTPSTVPSVSTTASWVRMVKSTSPSWRSWSTALTLSRTLSRSAWARVCRIIRNSPARLKSCIAVATGMIAMSSRLMPTWRPRGSSTPMTRARRSPMRTEPPTACSPGKSSVAVLYPSTTTGAPRRTSPSGRKLPCDDAELLHRDHVARRSHHRDGAATLAVRDRLFRHHHRRDALHLGHRAQDRLDVLEREVVGHADRAREEPGGLVAAGEDDDEVGADRRELLGDVAARAFAERGEEDHRPDADRHADQAEHGAQPVAEQGAQGEEDEIVDAHARRVRSRRWPAPRCPSCAARPCRRPSRSLYPPAARRWGRA